MKQLLQHLGSGQLSRCDVPCPAPKPNQLLIETRASLISPGTERMLVEFGRAGWLAKARRQPDRLRQVIDKARADGVTATWNAVRSKLDHEIPLGYANAGVVRAVGAGVTGWRAGDRVVSNGAHAEMVTAASSLCAPIPDGVGDQEAPFAILAAIALQAVRLAAPTLGERVVVTGLGLVGLLAAQLLRHSGCRVLGLDPHPGRLALAERWGIETHRVTPDAGATLDRASRFTGGHGVDAVIIAAATASNEPVAQAASMCRQRGRIVLAGVAGLELSRDLFYKKELTFQVSCSYGPGRYDPAYENRGQDYPRGQVRWTAQRNMAAALDLMAEGRLDVAPLISHRFDFAQALEAYSLLTSGEPSLGVLLRYPGESPAGADGRDGAPKLDTRIVLTRIRKPEPAAGGAPAAEGEAPVVGLLGAGNYACHMLLPELARAGARLDTVVSRSGLDAAWAGRRFPFERTASDEAAILENPDIDTVFIATRHDSHARLAVEALRRGKSVWVEKPLALDLPSLEMVTEAWITAASPRLMIGFNRRFAPLAVALRQQLPAGPKEFRYTVNAGAVAPDHWSTDPSEGGGRILGEACHFVDLLRWMAGTAIRGVEARRGAGGAQLWMEFTDGSTAAVDYLTTGARGYPKERLEVFGAGRVWVLDNFRSLAAFPRPFWPGWPRRQDKGQAAAVQAFLESIRRGTPSPIRFDEIEEVSRWTILAAAQLRD